MTHYLEGPVIPPPCDMSPGYHVDPGPINYADLPGDIYGKATHKPVQPREIDRGTIYAMKEEKPPTPVLEAPKSVLRTAWEIVFGLIARESASL